MLCMHAQNIMNNSLVVHAFSVSSRFSWRHFRKSLFGYLLVLRSLATRVSSALLMLGFDGKTLVLLRSVITTASLCWRGLCELESRAVPHKGIVNCLTSRTQQRHFSEIPQGNNSGFEDLEINPEQCNSPQQFFPSSFLLSKPSKQLHLNDPTVLVHTEFEPQIFFSNWHSSFSESKQSRCFS